jgi:predicted metal-dependent phosphoesterase TrpH
MAAESVFPYRIDLHVHTRRYSPCAESLNPEQLPRCIERAGLQGVVITEHDQLWTPEAIAGLNRSMTAGRIYRGVEVSSRNGHFIIIGPDRLGPLAPGISVAALLGYADQCAAAVIWAHPYLNYGAISQPLTTEDMPDGIHAVEVFSGVTRDEQSRQARSLAERRGWTAVGGSDAHSIGQVGYAYTCFAELPDDEKALAAAIRQGRCRAAHQPPLPLSGRAACC